MTTAKNKLFIELLLENCYFVGKIKIWWGGEGGADNGGRLFTGGGDEQTLGSWRGGTLPSRENPVILYIKARKENYFYDIENLKN